MPGWSGDGASWEVSRELSAGLVHIQAICEGVPPSPLVSALWQANR